MKIKILLTIILFYNISNAQIVNIPDENFKNALLSHSPTIDTSNDGEIQISEAEATLEIDVHFESINDLTGIEKFINITTLECEGNNLSTLDLSFNTLLTYVICEMNQLTEINVSNSLNLTEFYCSTNQLTNIDISNNTLLTQFFCSSNQLTNLDVSNNTLLISLACQENQLSEIDVSNNAELLIIGCGSNLITELNFNNNPNFRTLNCSNSSNLTNIYLKNGNNDNITFEGFWASNFENLPNLESICIDDINNTSLTNSILNQVGHDITFTDNCTLSLNENNLFDLQVYPNPTKNILNITSNVEIKQIEVFNLLGQSVLKHTNQNNINVSYLSKGIYTLKIIDVNKQFTFKKFIKK